MLLGICKSLAFAVVVFRFSSSYYLALLQKCSCLENGDNPWLSLC